MNYYSRLKAKIRILEIICRKHGVDLDKEPLYIKFLSGKVEKIGDISLNNNSGVLIRVSKNNIFLDK